MEDDPHGGQERVVTIGQQSVRVTDPLNVMPVAADAISEFRLIDNVIHVSLGSYIWDGSGPPELRVCARLRLPLDVASTIQSFASKAIDDAKKAREAAN